MRAFPLSNWTELDIWHYLRAERIPIVPLYFAQERPVIRRKGVLIPQLPGVHPPGADATGEDVELCTCRFRSLGCIPCTGAVASSATTLDAIIAEVGGARKSERENRIIDLTSESSMEQKKKEGYF